jgi:hypothetical protein
MVENDKLSPAQREKENLRQGGRGRVADSDTFYARINFIIQCENKKMLITSS